MKMPASMEPDWKALLRVLRAHSATFYLGSLLFPKEARKGAWAVYAACRLGDEAVDGEGGGREAEAGAVKLGLARQLTNILRDVGEDLERDRVYLPLDLLRAHGVEVEDLRAGRVTPGYRALMAHLEGKARALYREGLAGLGHLKVGRAAIALAALQYRGILDKLRLSGYDNLGRRAHLKAWERALLLPKAFLAARFPPRPEGSP